LARLDATTATETTIGYFGSLATWSGECRVNRVLNAAFAIGNDVGNNPKLYAVTLSKGQESEATVDSGFTLAGNLDNGDLLLLFWDGTEEQVSVLDPSTGAQDTRASIGDLATWSGQLAVDSPNDTIYVVGANANKDWSLYTVEVLRASWSALTITTPYMLASP
jgi:hypothetical protein